MSDETQTRAGSGRQTARTLLGFALLAVIAFLAWPSNLGGLTTLDVVAGHSMEPKFHTGDLVVARAGIAPKVGDVIVYQPPGLKTRALIVHRIIGVAPGGGWVMKGDNNNFIDPFQPKGQDVLGVVVIHIPGVGAILRSPLVWGSLLIFATALLLLTSALRSGREDDETILDEHHPDETILDEHHPDETILDEGGLDQGGLDEDGVHQESESASTVTAFDDSWIDPEVAALLRDVDTLFGRDLVS